jgi:HK97 family phage portal protein
VKSPWAWFNDLFARKGQDPMQVVRYVLPYPVAGVNLLPDEILSLATVWACIDAIARAIGQCKLNVYQPGPNGRRELLSNDSLMYLLNTRPNPEMTAIGFREAMLFMGIPYGNAYAEIVRDGGGRVAALWPLPSDRVTPRRDQDTWELFYEYRQPNGEIVQLEQRQVFHLRGPGLYGLLGDNLVARAAKSMAVSAAQERFTASFFGQGANPGGVLEFPGKLGEEQFNRLKGDFAEKRKGPENAHKPMILESGMKWTPTGTDPQKSQLIEGRQFSVEEICRWFGVPPHKVQHLLHATFSNIEHQSIEFVRDAVSPWCKRIEQEGDFKLLRQDRAPWRCIEFDTRPLLAGDAKSRAEGYAILRQNGIMTANEIREIEGMNHLGEDGDALLVQSNLTTVERLVNPPEPPAPALLPGKDPTGSDDPNTASDDPAADSGDAEADTVARQALTTIIAGALDRYARRQANRRRDLERTARASTGDVTARLEAERLKNFWPRLLEELRAAEPFAARALGRPLVDIDLQRAARDVDAGEPPAAVAAKLLPSTCPRTG